MATKTVPAKSAGAKTSSTRATPAKKTTSLTSTSSAKGKTQPNGSILSFFKKEEQGLFIEERSGSRNDTSGRDRLAQETGTWQDYDEDLYAQPDDSIDTDAVPSSSVGSKDGQRYNENGGSVKRRKVDGWEAVSGEGEGAVVLPRECTPPPPDVSAAADEIVAVKEPATVPSKPARRRVGPFAEDSDSEVEEDLLPRRRSSAQTPVTKEITATATTTPPVPADEDEDGVHVQEVEETEAEPPTLKREPTNYSNIGDFDEFEGMVDFEDDEYPLEGEEYQERRYMAEQRRLEMAEAGFEGDTGGFDDFPDEELLGLEDPDAVQEETGTEEAPSCPICSANLAGVSDQDTAIHVNNCLDGNPTPLPDRKPVEAPPEVVLEKAIPRFQRPVRPPKPGQENPIMVEGSTSATPTSAFSKLMSNHAEDAAWATAAAAENASRGKPAFQRTCPFYKIMPGMFICVDAFRYGGVKDCRAYFLSHFHSDHYIGLTANWSHGPIFGSRVTNNLVRTQLRVDPKYVVDLEFEKKTEVPGTPGVFVTMIPANHCPGSSLFLFEKVIGKGKTPRVQRILHCGDFRACKAHIEHPLLKPDVVDSITGSTKQQKIDVCYLDTTYLNPKYAFPGQEEVIKACADMCVSLNNVRADESDGWEQMKRERAGAGMVKFVQKDPQIKQEDGEEDTTKPDPAALDAMAVSSGPSKVRGRLLVVVGTYSIGKERICLGIARALDSKIYAPPNKQRICACLEDPELNARLTKDPREAQVHMTPLFEIRADTLDDYLKDFRDTFSRAVGFRPTGWNYRPPNSRFVESPAVATVLRGQNWKSNYSMRELVPQRGSTSRASCFGVPYSEHSSFRELTMFCCALRIEKVVPTVNVGSARSRERMRSWVERWMMERKKNGLFRLGENGNEW